MALVCGRPLNTWIEGCTRRVCLRGGRAEEVLLREEEGALLAGVQQQQGVGLEVEDSSMVVRQQHVLSEPHASGALSDTRDEMFVIALTSSLM